MNNKSYVNKNQYGYDIMGIIIDDDAKIIHYYSACQMPIGKHKKVSKKIIKEMIDIYKDAGYSLKLLVQK